MSAPADAQSEGRNRRRHEQMRVLRWLAAIAAGALLFALGVSVGEALRDNPRPGVTTTSVTTVQP